MDQVGNSPNCSQHGSSPGTTPLRQRPYRSKKIQPCDLCRKRKVGCTIEPGLTACSLCLRRGTQCTFQSQPVQKRGRSGGPNAKDQGKSSSLRDLKISFLNLEQATRRQSNSLPWFDHSTMMKGHTCLYSGSSGDQGPDLLRHLSFNEQNLFGSSSWSAWRVLPRVEDPVYFTIFPDHNLDPHSEMYSNRSIEQLLTPYEPQLIDLYYAYVHPSYPVMEPKEEFIVRRQNGQVRASLMICLSCLAIEFWDKSEFLQGRPAPDNNELWNHIFIALAIETRTPNLDTVRALLLYMQLPSHYVKEPNRPGHWALSSLLVGVAQDIGLNNDPSEWNIPASERKARRVLWWAVYSHDKWMAHWLGRPSNLSFDSWDVKPLAYDDFSDNSSRLHVNDINSVKIFMAFTKLSCILDEVLQKFYCVRGRASSDLRAVPIADDDMLAKVEAWTEQVGIFREDFPPSPNVYSLHIALHTVELSIMRAVHRYQHGELGIIQRTTRCIRQILQALNNMCELSLDRLWPSYCTGNLQIIGSILITLFLSSIDDQMLDERASLLLDFQVNLQNLSQSNKSAYETARLPLIRLSLILDQIFKR